MVQTQRAQPSQPANLSPAPRKRHRFDLFVVLGLLAAGLFIYAQTTNYPFISFDDPGYIVENPHVHRGWTWENWRWAWTSLEQSNWHPLTWLSLMLDAQFYGLNAGGYHLTNLLLHLGNAGLLYAWLRQATGARWPSALTAFFFVAHPLHVESVAWVTERKDVLSTFLFFLTLLAYTRYTQRRERSFYGWAVGFFALGLTAKPMLVTLPPLLLLLDYWPLRRWNRATWRHLLVEKWPFAILAVASCVVTLIAQRAAALVPLAALSIPYRLAAAASGYGTYLYKTIVPLDLGVYYPYQRPASWWEPVGWLAVLAVLTVVAFRARRSRPYLLVGWCWFAGTLVPVIGVVQVGGQAVADRYTYLPHVGLFVAVFWLGAEAWQRVEACGRRALAALGIAAAAGALTLSHQQATYWRSSAALLERTFAVATRPTIVLCELLGNAEIESKHFDKATDAYWKAWQLGSTSNATILSLGTLLLREKRYQETAEVLAPASERADATADLLNDLALAQANSGQKDKALGTYQLCTERFPRYALARFGWAELLQKSGDLAESAVQDEAGLALCVDWLPALRRLAWDYSHSADPQTRELALKFAERAMQVSGGREPGSLNVLAFALGANGRWPEAVAAATAAMETVKTAGGSAGSTTACQVRLDCYRQGRLPD